MAQIMTCEMASLPIDQSATEHVGSRALRVAAVVFLGPLMTQIDSTVVNVSLSSISHDLHASLDSVQWIISGYLLAVALTMPLNAWLVHRLGSKRLYLWCFSAFTLASGLCGMETTINGLIWARVFQGMAGGLLTPMAEMMLARAAGRHMARVMGYTTSPVFMAPLLGPVLAGAILKYASWPRLFYVNLPIGIVAVALAVFVLPTDETRTKGARLILLGSC
jgi:MFS family permease